MAGLLRGRERRNKEEIDRHETYLDWALGEVGLGVRGTSRECSSRVSKSDTHLALWRLAAWRRTGAMALAALVGSKFAFGASCLASSSHRERCRATWYEATSVAGSPK